MDGEDERKSVARLETLVDGVFAIAMTLLVLDIVVPQVAEGDLPAQLTNLGVKLFVYAISFVILGVYWVGHHYMFRVIRRANFALIWLNIGFLMAVALVPFCAAFLSAYPRTQIAVVIYGAALGLGAGAAYAIWWYVTKDSRLVDPGLDPVFVRYVRRRIVAGPFVALLGIGLSFLSTDASIVLYAILPPVYLLQGGIDRFFMQPRTP